MNAAELARTAAQLTQVADGFKTEPDDKYTGARNLIVYHLRTAARLSRELAEALPK